MQLAQKDARACFETNLIQSYNFQYNNNNNNNNVIYIAPFTMCSRRLEESRKKMRFKFVFEPVHMIDSTDTARQPIPKMRPSHRKGTEICSPTRDTNFKTVLSHLSLKGRYC